MTLLEFIKSRKMSMRKFSRVYDLDYMRWFRICRGICRPSLVDVFIAEAASGGVIKPKSWLTEEEQAMVKAAAKKRGKDV